MLLCKLYSNDVKTRIIELLKEESTQRKVAETIEWS